jgi:hypothetical protein
MLQKIKKFQISDVVINPASELAMPRMSKLSDTFVRTWQESVMPCG